MKIRRNDPCWCGSGVKYKKCHLDRVNAERIPRSEAFAATKSSQRARGCNCPPEMRHECNGEPIRSHSISKALGLTRLAEAGHVLSFRSDFKTLSESGGRAQVGSVGINKMSVFPGFCGVHDKRLFSAIEDRPFAGTAEQCALLSYRAMARERHAKAAASDMNEFLKGADRGKSLVEQIAMQQFLSVYGLGLTAAAEDIERALSEHHQAIISENFTVFESLALEFSDEFPLLCSTGHMPSDDWSGKVLQNLTDQKLKADWLTAVSFHSGGKAWVVFTWLRSCSAMSSFMNTLQDNFPGREADALIKYFFSISENVAIKPSWWASLNDMQKATLGSRIMDGVPIGGGPNVVAPRPNEPTVLNLPLLSSSRI